MQRLTEQSIVGQITSILGMISAIVALFGGAMIVIADSAIDNKYATDRDLQHTQRQFSTNVEALSEIVQKNTQVSKQTSAAVESLALSMVTIQIRQLEPMIVNLEQHKAAEGHNWSPAEEAMLRGMHRTIAELEAERARLLRSHTRRNQ